MRDGKVPLGKRDLLPQRKLAARAARQAAASIFGTGWVFDN
jgi:hypothetical protein